MNVGSTWPIAWNNSRPLSSLRFFVHCGIEESGSPGIICMLCHQVLRHRSEHGISSMGKHLLAKAHIAKLNKLTVSEVTEFTSSMVAETAFAILQRQGSWGITMGSLLRKMIFDIQLNPYWPEWQTKGSDLAAKDFESSDFCQDTWNRYLMLGFVSAHIPWNTISHLELQRSYKTLCDDLVLLSARTLSNIWHREYALTVDSIRKQLPWQNKVDLALNRWTSTNKLAIKSVIAY
jgi:hypothetical protein